jgi:hypothetical protein
MSFTLPSLHICRLTAAQMRTPCCWQQSDQQVQYGQPYLWLLI